MEMTTLRTIWTDVTIGGLVLTFVGAGLGLLGYIQTGKVSRRIAAMAPYAEPIASAAAVVRLNVASEKDLNTEYATKGGLFRMANDMGLLLTAANTRCRARQLGDGRLEYYGDFTVSPDDVCMGKAVSVLRSATAAVVRFVPMTESEILGGTVALLVNGALRFDIPIPEQTTETGAAIVPDIGEIMQTAIPAW